MRLRTPARLLVALPVALLLPADAPAARAQEPPRVPRPELVARLDSIVHRYLADSQATGGTVVVARGGDLLYARGFGERDRERHLPATPETVYPIGSVTKTFTAAAVMQLVEEGRVALDDPVTTYLPQFPRWSAVTVRHLLSHTSGIPLTSPAWRALWDRELPPADYVRVLADTLVSAPGAQFRYANTGYMVLGLVIEAVTGRPYGDVLAERVFRPLGMRSARMCATRDPDTLYARGYGRLVGAVAPTTEGSIVPLFSAGALCMSAPDLLRWARALVEGRVVSPAGFARMARSDTAGGAPTEYGFGLAPGRLGAHATVWHNGAVAGAQAQMLTLPEDSLYVVILTNVKGHPVERLSRNLAAAVLGLPFEREGPLVAVPAAPEALARYAGTYELTASFGRLPLRVALDGTTLVAGADGYGVGRVPLVPLGEHTFGAASRPGVRLRFVMAGDRPSAVELVQGGPVIRGPRLGGPGGAPR